MNNKEIYNEIFKVVLLLEDEKIQDACIDNVPQWDSLEHFHLVTEIEKKFNIKFENEEISAFLSYESGLKILRKHGVAI